WLYGVAYRTSLKMRSMTRKRRDRERHARPPEPPAERVWQDLVPLLDRELNRLPDKYRVPVVLCDLEGHSRRDVARRLGWPEGTLSGRLARARALLAKRLRRHVPTLSGGALAAVLDQNAAAGVPVWLLRATFRIATGQAA